MKRYDDGDTNIAISILRSHAPDEYDAAVQEIRDRLGRGTTKSDLSHWFARRGLRTPGSYLGQRVVNTGDNSARFSPREPAAETNAPRKASQPRPLDQIGQVEQRGKFEDLLKHTRRPITFDRLCDALDMPPGRVRRLVDEARRLGYSVNVAGDEIGWEEPAPVQDERTVLPVTGDRTVIGVISDTHFGSKYCLREYLRDFVAQAHDAGARLILHCGDMLDGAYKHGRWELSHHGLDEQIEDCITTLPKLDGLRYCFIDGNHDSTFWDSTGYPTGRAIVDNALREGRTDLEYVGARGAVLRVGGIKVELWHPKKGTSYALSYHLQNHIRDMALGRKPDILLAGHWHTSVYVEQRAVHSFACGTFQGGGSQFSKSIGGAPSIGGWILSWETTEHGTLRRLGMQRVSYFEREEPREVA